MNIKQEANTVARVNGIVNRCTELKSMSIVAQALLSGGFLRS